MRVNRGFFAVCRTLHVYLTMLGLLVMLLFSISGFTLNHEDWFGATTPYVTQFNGHVPLALIKSGDRLGIVEFLRKNFPVSGAMTEFEDLGGRLNLVFKGPGQTWDFEIEKSGGHASARNEAFNFVAVLNNLHRGRYTGAVWSWVIDGTAALVALACATGLVLWLSLPQRRTLGLVFLLLGSIGIWCLFHFLTHGTNDERLSDLRTPGGINSAP